MEAFHNKQSLKDFYVNRVKEHIALDEITKGVYFEDGEPGKRRMCGVGCTIHSNNHNAYETELGIPEWLARVEDTIFEGLPNYRAKTWPQEFLEAIPVGKDLDQIIVPFIIFILESNTHFDRDKFPDVAKAIDDVIALYKAGKTPEINIEEFEAARSAAESAESAAWSAAESAESAARSAARSARSAAWSAAFMKFADKLLELMENEQR